MEDGHPQTEDRHLGPTLRRDLFQFVPRLNRRTWERALGAFSTFKPIILSACFSKLPG